MKTIKELKKAETDSRRLLEVLCRLSHEPVEDIYFTDAEAAVYHERQVVYHIHGMAAGEDLDRYRNNGAASALSKALSALDWAWNKDGTPAEAASWLQIASEQACIYESSEEARRELEEMGAKWSKVWREHTRRMQEIEGLAGR